MPYMSHILLGNGWRPSRIFGYWDNETYKGWTIVCNSCREYSLLYDNRFVSVKFSSLQEMIGVADTVIELLNKTVPYIPKEYPIRGPNFEFSSRIEYVAFDSLNKLIGYFFAKDRNEAILVVKQRYKYATWFMESTNLNKYNLKGSRYASSKY